MPLPAVLLSLSLASFTALCVASIYDTQVRGNAERGLGWSIMLLLAAAAVIAALALVASQADPALSQPPQPLSITYNFESETLCTTAPNAETDIKLYGRGASSASIFLTGQRTAPNEQYCVSLAERRDIGFFRLTHFMFVAAQIEPEAPFPPTWQSEWLSFPQLRLPVIWR